jgi:hypothetical protein
MIDPNLPDYRQLRLVLLVVDPYVVHAYWKDAAEKLQEIQEQTGQAQGVLRFYPENNPESGELPGGFFDIRVDLNSGNYYVHLWSPEQTLYADLGVERDDGTLIRLTRSQVVHLPRARPVIETEQHFMKIEADEHHAEIIPPPPLQHDRPQNQADSVEVPALDDVADTPPSTGVTPQNHKVQKEDLKPIDFAEVVNETLRQVFAARPWRAETAPDSERYTPLPAISAGSDLTAIAESHFPSSLSSSELQKNRQEGLPDTTK